MILKLKKNSENVLHYLGLKILSWFSLRKRRVGSIITNENNKSIVYSTYYLTFTFSVIIRKVVLLKLGQSLEYQSHSSCDIHILGVIVSGFCSFAFTLFSILLLF